MNPDRIYQGLKELAEKIEIQVREQNFRKAGMHVKSGFCVVKGKQLFIMDKHLKVQEKIEVLSEFLSDQPMEDIYILPVLREQLDGASSSRKEKDADGNDPPVPTPDQKGGADDTMPGTLEDDISKFT